MKGVSLSRSVVTVLGDLWALLIMKLSLTASSRWASAGEEKLLTRECPSTGRGPGSRPGVLLWGVLPPDAGLLPVAKDYDWATEEKPDRAKFLGLRRGSAPS